MQLLNESQLERLSEFFSNMAIVWFAGSFIGSTDIFLAIQYTAYGIISLVVSLVLSREVNNES